MNKMQLSEQITDQVYEALWRFILVRVCDPHTAEGVLRETILRAAEEIDRVQNSDDFRDRLFTTATRECHRALRRQQRPRLRIVSDAQGAPNPTVEGAYIGGLSAEIRQIVALYAEDDLTFAEIAELLHRDADAIEAEYLQARDAFAEAVEVP